MTPPSDPREEHRKAALTAFLDARVGEGYRIETRTDTHAIIGPARERRSFLARLRERKAPARQVISVDSDGNVTARPAEPIRA